MGKIVYKGPKTDALDNAVHVNSFGCMFIGHNIYQWRAVLAGRLTNWGESLRIQ
jgi:hypothetical protein